VRIGRVPGVNLDNLDHVDSPAMIRNLVDQGKGLRKSVFGLGFAAQGCDDLGSRYRPRRPHVAAIGSARSRPRFTRSAGRSRRRAAAGALIMRINPVRLVRSRLCLRA